MKKTKAKNRNKYMIFIILFIVFLLLRNVYIVNFKYRTKLLNLPESHSVNIPVTALVVRNESVYLLDQKIEQETDSRIPARSNIGSLSQFRNDLGVEEKELQNLEKLYLKKESLQVSEKIEGEALDREEIEIENFNNLLDLKEYLIEENFEEAYKYIEKEYSEELFTMEEKTLKDLQFQIFQETISQQGMDLKALSPGMISTKIDGFETIYNYSNFYKLNSKIITKFNKITPKNGLKIINNNKIGLHFHIPTENLLNVYGIGNEILINIQGKEILGKILDMQIINENTIFQIEVRDGFEFFRDYRFVDLELINYKTKAFKFPKNALIKKEEQTGVFVKNSSGLVKFVPIEILEEDSKNLVVNAGVNGEILQYNKRVKTVEPFDEIILNPKLLEEGMLLD